MRRASWSPSLVLFILVTLLTACGGNSPTATMGGWAYYGQTIGVNSATELWRTDGTTVELKGNEEVEYDGELHSAANLYDAMKEGYYGKF